MPASDVFTVSKSNLDEHVNNPTNIPDNTQVSKRNVQLSRDNLKQYLNKQLRFANNVYAKNWLFWIFYWLFCQFS